MLPGGGLTVRLAQAVGVRRARQISLTGEYVSAARALQDRLVNEVVAPDELLARAQAIAAAITQRGAWIVGEVRSAYERTLNLSADDALGVEAQLSRQGGIPAEHVHTTAPGLIERGSAQLGGTKA